MRGDEARGREPRPEAKHDEREVARRERERETCSRSRAEREQAREKESRKSHASATWHVRALILVARTWPNEWVPTPPEGVWRERDE